MYKKRRKFSPEFKGRVTLGAMNGEHTFAEFASKYSVHPNQISTLKKQAKEGMVASFSGKVQTDQQASEAQIKELHTKIGQLAVENYFFYKEPSPKFERSPKVRVSR